MKDRTPAQLFALVFGAVLVLAGVIGFFYETSFAIGDDSPREAVLGILDVNGWHNVVHLASGAIGLAVMGSAVASRTYALGLGVVYVLVTILGFAVGNGGTILGLVPINTEDNILHLLIALAALGAYFASSPRAAAAADAGPRTA